LQHLDLVSQPACSITAHFNPGTVLMAPRRFDPFVTAERAREETGTLRAKETSAPDPRTPSAGSDLVDCIVLCGGYASRLWPLTLDMAKTLLPIAGKPCLNYVLDRVFALGNLGRVLLVVNEKLAPQIEAFARRNPYGKLEIVVEPPNGEKEQWGPIEALDFVVSRVGMRDLLVIGGDNLFEFDLTELVASAKRRDVSSLAVHRHDSLEDVSEYGVVRLDESGIVADFREKEKTTRYRDVSTACYYFRAEELRLLGHYIETSSGVSTLGGYIHWLHGRGVTISGRVFTEPWFDIGTRSKLLEANRYYLRDRQRGKITESSIKGPVQIEAGASVTSSIIGPSVYLGLNVEVTNSEIVNSVVMDGTTIHDSVIKDSIVGPDSHVQAYAGEFVCGRGALLMMTRGE
jgi:glucose-1-phosphate thymidylyltransferase